MSSAWTAAFSTRRFSSSVYAWRKQARETGLLLPDSDSGPEGRLAGDKFEAVLETTAFNETKLVVYCQAEGIWTSFTISYQRASRYLTRTASPEQTAHINVCNGKPSSRKIELTACSKNQKLCQKKLILPIWKILAVFKALQTKAIIFSIL